MLARTPEVYAVIVNYNGWRDTVECLESLMRSEYDALKVLVVDNASTDGSVAHITDWARGAWSYAPTRPGALDGLTLPPIAKPVDYAVVSEARGDLARPAPPRELPRLTLIASSSNRGFAAGNNVAFRLLMDIDARGYVCLVNNDMAVAPTAIRALVTAIEGRANVAAVGGVILDYTQPDVAQMVGGGRLSRLGMSNVFGAGAHRAQIERPSQLGYITGGLLLTRVDTLREIGLLDEDYFLYAEDADWGERMRNAGYELDCAVDAVVWHKGSQTIGAGSAFQDYHVVKSMLHYVRKHTPYFLPLAFPNSLLRCLVPKLVRAEWKRARSVAKAHIDALR